MAAAKRNMKKLFGFDGKSWISEFKLEKKISFKSKPDSGYLYFLGTDRHEESFYKEIARVCPKWQVKWVREKKSNVVLLQTDFGPVWLVKGQLTDKSSSHHGMLTESLYARARDLTGSVVSKLKEYSLDKVYVVLADADEEQTLGALVGLEIASYSYRTVRGEVKNKLPKLHISGVTTKLVEKASDIAVSVNVARHLVNVPALELNPKTYGEFTLEMFKGVANTKVEVWAGARIIKEKLFLIEAVGRAGEERGRLIHIKYRPTTKTRLKAPIAFVGKGVTFDTGGLNIKPGGSMRLMKKDMGGSASILGLAWWVVSSKLDIACDFYLALADNAIDERAIRPGDVLKSPSGKTIEIHNTDAEGRLVLADALYVAAGKKGKEKPKLIVDAATLTGAMRVALGLKVAGMFANSDKVGDLLQKSSVEKGDLCWRMPLFQTYREELKSHVADMVNCGSGYGGGITAALFLESFVEDHLWAHVDMMGWNDKPYGALSEVGGNGQMVQGLIGMLENIKESDLK